MLGLLARLVTGMGRPGGVGRLRGEDPPEGAWWKVRLGGGPPELGGDCRAMRVVGSRFGAARVVARRVPGGG